MPRFNNEDVCTYTTLLDRIPHDETTTKEGRTYTVNGERFLLESVTTNLRVINAPDMNDWRVKHGKEESDRLRDEGGDIGTMAHKAALRLANGEGYGMYEWERLGFPVPVGEDVCKDERVRNCVRGLTLVMKDHKLTPGNAELFVWSRKYLFAGTLDKVEINDGYADIYDWKTSGRLFVPVWLQLAAYAIAFEECYGIPVRRIYPVRLDRGLPNTRSARYELGREFKKPDGTVVHEEYKEGTAINDAFYAYLNALQLGQYIKSQGGRY